MSTHEEEGLGYSAFKIFIILFILTAAEVAWGEWMRGFGRFVLWGGLLSFALAKGVLILMYFMHMKYEKMIVWSLILPTPLLILVVVCALMPDISNNSRLDYPIGTQMNYETGELAGLDMSNQHAGHGEHADNREHETFYVDEEGNEVPEPKQDEEADH